MFRSNVLAIGGLVVGCALAGAASAATHVLTYNVESPTFGTIGTYTNTILQNGDAADIRTDLHVAVKPIGIQLFHQDAKRQERWQRQRLVSFQSYTDDNGTEISVTGRAEGDHFVIQSTNGTLKAPAEVYPSNPWSSFLLKSGIMMSTKTGRLTSVIVKDMGDVNATFDGRTIRVHQWDVDGSKHEVVWIDDGGVIVAFQTQENGHTVDFVLKNLAGDTATANAD